MSFLFVIFSLFSVSAQCPESFKNDPLISVVYDTRKKVKLSELQRTARLLHEDSLDKPLFEDSNLTFIDTVENVHFPSPYQAAVQEETREMVEEVFEQVIESYPRKGYKERLRSIVYDRILAPPQTRMTLEEVAEKNGVRYVNTIQQAEKTLLRKFEEIIKKRYKHFSW